MSTTGPSFLEALTEEKVPRILYRYSAIDKNLERTFMGSYLWACNALLFNDPFDCDLPIATVGPPEKMMARVEEYLQANPHSPETAVQARAAAKEGRFYKGEGVNEGVKRRTVREAGVVCFSKVHDDILMWSHYAAKHQGICLGFDTTFSPWMGEAKRVRYAADIPQLSMADDGHELLAKLTYTKSEHWKYEQEWRFMLGRFKLVSDADERRKLPLHPRVLRRVIFGCNVSNEGRREVMELLGAWSTPVHLYDAVRHPSKFGLVLQHLGLSKD